MSYAERYCVVRASSCRLRSIFFILLMCANFEAVASTARPVAENKLISVAVNRVIIPDHSRLTERVNRLAVVAKKFCDADKTISYQAVRDAWLEAMSAWSRIRPIDFGPIDDTNVGFRFQFWPDPLNLVHRKFRSRVNGANKALHPESLASAGAAIQGLSAIEYLLYDAKVGSEHAYRVNPQLCPILTGTINNLHHQAIELQQLWVTDYGPLWTSTEADKAQAKRRVESLFSGMVMSLSEIRDLKLGKALSIDNPKSLQDDPPAFVKPNPWLLEAWRSQSSLTQIHSTLLANQQLYQLPHGFSDYLLAQTSDNEALDKRIKAQFSAILAHLNKNQTSAFALLQQQESSHLFELYRQIHHLYMLLKVEYTRATGIQFRFNAKDGD